MIVPSRRRRRRICQCWYDFSSLTRGWPLLLVGLLASRHLAEKAGQELVREQLAAQLTK
jgi:hypothetical protein